MKRNEEEVEYYYDSSADQWWCFDKEQGGWVPWNEEESEDGGGAEAVATAAGVEGEVVSNGAAAASTSVRQDARLGAAGFTEGTGEATPDMLEDVVPSDDPRATEELGGKRPDAASADDVKDSADARMEDDGTASSATASTSCPSSVVGAADDAKEAIDHRSLKENYAATEAGVLTHVVAAGQSEAHTKTALSSGNSKSARVAAGGADTKRERDAAGAGLRDGKDKQHVHPAGAEKNHTEEKTNDTEDDLSGQAVDRLRSALESLATSTCLDQALIQLGSRGSFDRGASGSLGVGRIFGEITKEKVDHEEGGSEAGELRRDGSEKAVGLRRANPFPPIAEEKTAEADDEDEADDVVTQLPRIVKQDPIVRRSTRMLTFKDKGGLAGCLREAAKQRSDMIREAGGYIPGTEEYREEAWKQRARQLASQTHARTQDKWRDAARKVFDAGTRKPQQGNTMHFAEVVDRIRRSSEGDREKALRVQADLTGSAAYSAGSNASVGLKNRASLDSELPAAKLILNPDVDLRERRRRSSGFPGGQQGHVRFADAAFRDPNSQLQMQDLLTHQSRRKAIQREEDAASASSDLKTQESGASGE